LRVVLAGTRALGEAAKTRLRTLAGRRLTDEDAVLIIAREHRSQEQNRNAAEARLAMLVRAALTEPRPRHATKPTRASKIRRLEGKTRRGSIKRQRGHIQGDD